VGFLCEATGVRGGFRLGASAVPWLGPCIRAASGTYGATSVAMGLCQVALKCSRGVQGLVGGLSSTDGGWLSCEGPSVRSGGEEVLLLGVELLSVPRPGVAQAAGRPSSSSRAEVRTRISEQTGRVGVLIGARGGVSLAKDSRERWRVFGAWLPVRWPFDGSCALPSTRGASFASCIKREKNGDFSGYGLARSL